MPVLAIAGGAEAGVLAHIDLSNQRMNVYVNGKPRYNWPVSTARRGYRTPTGTFKPTALVRYHASMKARRCPSIFFLRGYAIHGSYDTQISRATVAWVHQAPSLQPRPAPLFASAAARDRNTHYQDQPLTLCRS